MAFGDRSESKGNKPAAPKVKPSKPPAWKPSQGDVKTNVDRARAENYKKTPDYAKSIRAGYSAGTPEARRGQADKAQARAHLKGPSTFNGISLRNSREDKIVLAEHARRVRQSQQATTFSNPANDISADVSTAHSWERDHPEDTPDGQYKLQTGQTAWGPRRKSDAETRRAANQPGIETDYEHAIANVANALNVKTPTWEADDPNVRLPGDYGPHSGYVDPLKLVKKEDPDGGMGKLAALDFVSNPNNLLHMAGQKLVGPGVEAIAGLGSHLPKAAYALPNLAALKLASAHPEVAGNAAKDVVDLYAQALPSIYQLGAAGVGAAHGDTTKAAEQWKGLEDMATHPLTTLHDHPLLGLLMAKGGASVVGRVGGAAARVGGRLGSDTLRAAGSTVGRDPVNLPLTGSPIARRYSHDIISKYVVQKPADAVGKRYPSLPGIGAKAQAQRWEHRAADEMHGGNESTRRYHRAQVNHMLAKTLPHNKTAVKLVPFIVERTVRNPKSVKPDLERRLRHLQTQEQKLVGKENGPGKRDQILANQKMQQTIKELLGDDKLMSGSKDSERAFSAAHAFIDRQNIIDQHLADVGHLNVPQTLKGKAFAYAVEHMDASYDKSKHPTAKANEKARLVENERQAKIKLDRAKGKLATAEKRVKAEEAKHKTIEQRGRVPGGMERPLVLQRLDQELKATQAELRRATNRAEHAAERAGQATGSAAVRSESYDRTLLKSDPQYRRLRGEFSRTAQEKQTAQTNFKNSHYGAPAMYDDATRELHSAELDRTTAAHDTSHAHLHAYLDDVDAAAARGTTKIAGRKTGTTKAEVHYHTSGRAPERSLGRAEKAGAGHQAARVRRAELYMRERQLTRDIKKGEREASKLKSTDHERLANLKAARDQAMRDHANAKQSHAVHADTNKLFGKLRKSERTEIYGLVDKHGAPLGIDSIDQHLRDNGVEHGLADVGWFSHRPGISAGAAGYVPSSRTQFESRFTRTDKAARRGTYDISMEALAASMTRSQGILDAIGARRRFVETFVAPKGHTQDGDVIWYRSAEEAARAARGAADQGHDVIPFQVTDPRLDAGRRAAQQKHIELEADKSIADSAIPLDDRGQPPADAPPGHYGLITKSAAKRMREHEDAAVNAPHWQEFTQRWRNTVLYGTSMPKWVFGNLAEMALRSVIAGYGPRAAILGYRVMAEVENQVGHPQEAAFIRQYLLGGAHFSGTLARQIEFALRSDQGAAELALRRGIEAIARPKPLNGRRNPVFATWEGYKKVIQVVNKSAEMYGAFGAIGKLALKDRESWQHLQSGWMDALKVGDDAVKHLAQGLVDTPEQLRYARFVYDTIGRYTNLSPTMRKFVANYTPFGLWAVNAFKFGLVTIPRNHPVFAGLLSAAYLASEKDRNELGQSLWVGDKEDFLQGSLQFEGYGPPGTSQHNFSRYTPFGAFEDPLGIAQQQLLPQVTDIGLAAVGRDWKMQSLQRSDGAKVRLDDRAALAMWTFLEGMVPLLSVAHQLKERKGKPYINDSIINEKVKDGTKVPLKQAASSMFLPGYGYKNGKKAGGGRASSGPSTPDIKVPDINIDIP
jgi:hypothetical protein